MKVVSFQIVVIFEIDESIVLSCGTALKELQKKLGGRILSINAPDDAPPPLPRAVLKAKDTILKVALDRFDITTAPPSHVAEEIERALQFARQRFEPFVKHLETAMPKYEWAGVVSELEFPDQSKLCKSGSEAAAPVFDRLVNIDRKNRELGSFELKFGMRHDEHFVNYSITGFESRKVALPVPSQKRGFFSVDISDYPLIDCGVKISLDVNNRPASTKVGPIEDVDQILEKHLILTRSLISNLNLEGVLKYE